MARKHRKQKMVIYCKGGQVYLDGYVSPDIFDIAKGMYERKEYKKGLYRRLRNFLHQVRRHRGELAEDMKKDAQARAELVLGSLVGTPEAAGAGQLEVIKGGAHA